MWFPIQRVGIIFSDIILDNAIQFNVNRCLLEQRLALANIGTHWKMYTHVWELYQTSVHIEKCKPIFENWEYWENHILPNTMRISWHSLGHIGKYGPHASKWGANVTPSACGRWGTLAPHFSAYRAIFSDMSSPESGYCSNILNWMLGFSFREFHWCQSKRN